MSNAETIAARHDEALLAWLASRTGGRGRSDVESGAIRDDKTADAATDEAFDALDVAFGALVGGIGR
jgi:hypothetical protein